MVAVRIERQERDDVSIHVHCIVCPPTDGGHDECKFATCSICVQHMLLFLIQLHVHWCQ